MVKKSNSELVMSSWYQRERWHNLPYVTHVAILWTRHSRTLSQMHRMIYHCESDTHTHTTKHVSTAIVWLQTNRWCGLVLQLLCSGRSPRQCAVAVNRISGHPDFTDSKWVVERTGVQCRQLVSLQLQLQKTKSLASWVPKPFYWFYWFISTQAEKDRWWKNGPWCRLAKQTAGLLHNKFNYFMKVLHCRTS